jgi:hypothetical protein
MNTTEPPPVCGFDGNPDLYGLGVRSGIYIQAVSFFLAAFHLKKESAYLQSSAFVFLFAIFIALMRETANRTLRVPEAALINWMIIYQMMGVVTISSSAVSPGALIRMTLVIVIFLGYMGYNGWFWWSGIEVLPRAAPGCVEYGYFFAKVNVRGWFHTFSKVMWTIAVVILFINCLVFGSALLVGAILGRKSIKDWWEKRRQSPDRERFGAMQLIGVTEGALEAVGAEIALASESHHGVGKHRRALDFLLLCRVIFGAGFLLAVTVPPFELTIRWNQIRGVNSLNSVGQLVPFMLSVGQLIHILYSMARGKDSPLRKNTIVEGKDHPMPPATTRCALTEEKRALVPRNRK